MAEIRPDERFVPAPPPRPVLAPGPLASGLAARTAAERRSP